MSCLHEKVPQQEQDVVGEVVQVLFNRICEATAAVGDLVRVDLVTPSKVLVAVNNLINRPVIGVISDKPSSTVCTVTLSGVITVTPTLISGDVYLSPTGTFTTTKPTSDYIQIMGYSFGDGTMDLKPEKNLYLLTP